MAALYRTRSHPKINIQLPISPMAGSNPNSGTMTRLPFSPEYKPMIGARAPVFQSRIHPRLANKAYDPRTLATWQVENATCTNNIATQNGNRNSPVCLWVDRRSSSRYTAPSNDAAATRAQLSTCFHRRQLVDGPNHLRQFKGDSTYTAGRLHSSGHHVTAVQCWPPIRHPQRQDAVR